MTNPSMNPASFFPALVGVVNTKTTTSINYISTDQPLIIEVQKLLKKANFLKEKDFTEGLLDQSTIKAFKTFKKKAFLEYPEMLGETTAKALLEIAEIGIHPVPTDNPTDPSKVSKIIPTGKSIKLPGNQTVFLTENIGNSQYFTWAEATKNGTRMPESVEVVKNIVRLAEYLKTIRAYLNNKAIYVNSWYRDSVSNRAVGGVSNSTHIAGFGADIVVSGIPPLEVYKQLNHYHSSIGGLGRHFAFTHIDLRGFFSRWNY